MRRRTIIALTASLISVPMIVGWWVWRCGSSTAVEYSTFTDARDGKVYKSVKIGGQVWMAENLDFEIEDSRCYDDRPNRCAKYGRLYSWEAAVDACAGLGDGWRLPDKSDWGALADAAGGDSVVGAKLKSKTGWRWSLRGAFLGPAVTDEFGFSALPGGLCVGHRDGVDCSGIGRQGYWWGLDRTPWLLAHYHPYMFRYTVPLDIGLSVRCIFDTVSVKSVENMADNAIVEDTAPDSVVFETVAIGGRNWMKRNLNVKVSGSRCYDDKPENCDKYGRLYTWDAAMSACDNLGSGWRLPDSADWNVLIKVAGDRDLTGGRTLKSKTGWEAQGRDGGNGTDDFGFSALPGGLLSGGEFSDYGQKGSLWSATAGWIRGSYLGYTMTSGDEITIGAPDKRFGLSVRCVRD